MATSVNLHREFLVFRDDEVVEERRFVFQTPVLAGILKRE